MSNASYSTQVQLDDGADSLQFAAARDRLKDVVEETKLLYSSVFSSESGNTVYIKPENLQKTGAFKIRGAYNKISKLSLRERQKGLISSSAGNHAQGVAYAAQQLGVSATLVMPKTTPLIKVEATRSYGAQVVLSGDCYDEAYAEALRLQKEHQYLFVHPFNDLDVIEGQGTIGLEILDELENVDCILVPIGGGGLIAGIAAAVKSLRPDIKIIGVEPEGAKAMKLSMDNNKLTYLNTVDTIADGVAVKKPGDLTFSIIKDYVDEIVTVSDFDIMEAFLLLLEKHKLIGENAGVLSLAGLKKIQEKDKNIVCVVSGGNIDVLTISSLINRGLVSRGRIFCFSVDLPDKPGELLRISEILAKLNANVIKLNHNQFKSLDRLMDVQLEVTVETNGHKHIDQIVSEMHQAGYEIERVY
ncbi:threonine dehydratase [Geosporobacter subterraneus DSM 17957]|uniref:L-threonine dehydratase catabolic TdcB n=1 Tax=Geosporobacter subterraneus DSM 17957 TaxID=1121919 RepID=A0A1M6NWR7_9FIRM|nr:threonine ammonia-lyase [Geosporobacter subterraneus]SHK00189.1 threonine dehydratase [Geosporobacter subterraneus DSM 17957]